jgi:hypothetical protein
MYAFNQEKLISSIIPNFLAGGLAIQLAAVKKRLVWWELSWTRNFV